MEQVTFHLEVFDGPLDLLLQLLQKNKVSIYDIPVSKILEQYLDVIRSMQFMDLDVTSEFITMAAQLMYIKSKLLLPVYEDEEQEDPRAPLVEALLEYQRFKEVSGYLNNLSGLGRDLFVKPQERLEKDKQPEFHYTSDVLLRALRTIFERSERRLPPPVTSFSGIVGREPVPVEEKIRQIVHQFAGQSVIAFEALVLSAQSRSEVVAIFLAVLELSKTRKVCIVDTQGGYVLTLAGDVTAAG